MNKNRTPMPPTSHQLGLQVGVGRGGKWARFSPTTQFIIHTLYLFHKCFYYIILVYWNIILYFCYNIFDFFKLCDLWESLS